MDPRPLLVALVLLAAVLAVVLLRRHRRELGTPADRATFDTLHTASLAAPSLRQGLTHDGAKGAVKHLQVLLGTPGIAITDREVLLAWQGSIDDHAADSAALAQQTLTTGHPTVLGPKQLGCRDLECPNRNAITAAIVDGDTIVGSLVAFCPQPSASLVRAVQEVAGWVSAQVELAGAEQRETRLMQAELRALRAQISPHFIYNSLTAIATFVRTDPDRARELLLEFADFSRYALRRGGEYTTLAEEIRNVERYLELEQARFGDRLKVTLRVGPEVLPVRLPYLVIQPLVENAVRHGLEAGNGTVAIVVVDAGPEAEISVEDDGVGSDPEVIRRALAGDTDADSVGLGNVDGRLRQVYGDSYGLVVETAPGAGTKVSFRVPKFAPGVPLS
ncbi:MAG TPA: histidine kinase [Jatrophihabitans sp.]|jgi:two-component system LytT family sensor kinase